MSLNLLRGVLVGLLLALAGSVLTIQAAPPAPPALAPASQQDFQDLPPTDPFFTYVRDIYRAGVVSGYACGGAGEPCGPENLPYYRPGQFVTRSQMAKFTDLARKQPGIYIDTATDGQPIYVHTSAANGRAIQGDSNNGNGLHGTSSSSTASGVFGENTGAGFGVAGRSTGSGNAIFGDNNNPAGRAGYFNGNVQIVGTLSKSAGSFQIDDPVDPANKYLYHSFVESPDMMNIYNGNVTLGADGTAWVTMPTWFEALNQDFRYQLTALGAPGPNLYVAQEIQGNRFQIAGGAPGAKVSWQVTGIRHDPYAAAHRIPVEQDKPANERGYYLHPDLYGQPDSQQLGLAQSSSAPTK